MSLPEDVEDLLARVAKGDRAAFATLFQRGSPTLFALCLNVLDDRTEAEEVLQQVFVTVWTTSDSHRLTDLSPKAWLVTLARDGAIQRRRTQKRARVPIDTADLLPEAAIRQGAHRLDHLPRARAHLLRRVCLQGDGYADLAEASDVDRATLRNWMRRSLRDLSDPSRDDLMAQAAELALDLLPEEEIPDFEARLAVDRDLRTELAAWREWLADLVLDEVQEVAPPPQVRKRLEAVLFRPEDMSLWQSLWPYALGGLAAALLLWVASATDLLLPDNAASPALRAELVTTAGATGPALAVQLDPASGRVLVNRPPAAPPAGRVYELWLFAGDAAPLSLGLLDPAGDTVLTVPEDLRPGLPGARLAISDEAPDGSPTGAPTGALLAEGVLTAS